MKIVTYNINGIRAGIRKDVIPWLKAVNADVVCLQEVKATLKQIDVTIFESIGYHVFWNPAKKKGYSGVAVLTKQKPISFSSKMGIEKYDDEGRILKIDFETISIINVYMPSGSSSEERQLFKLGFLQDFQDYINTVKEDFPKLVVCGDYNICHQSIDIHNPKANNNSPGFTPDERNWMDTFLKNGFIDSFREFNKEAHHYTWWSYMAKAREKNLGWRIDYICVTKNLQKHIIRAILLTEAKHSDHCPVLMEIE